MGDKPLRVGVLFESNEWSDHKLARELQRELGEGAEVRLIDMETADALDRALECDALVSRVFASAGFRGHDASLARMPQLIRAAEQAGVRLINPGRAHAYEVSKLAAANALVAAGIAAPKIYARGNPSRLLSGGTFAQGNGSCAAANAAHSASSSAAGPAATSCAVGSASWPASRPCESPALDAFPFPCVMKPDRGGRTTHTIIARDVEEARAFLEDAPDVPFVVEEYVEPERGFVTRIEMVSGAPELVVKRSVAENGLSAYRFGSTYQLYPDCAPELLAEAARAAAALGFEFGSFDVIETERGAFFIDANSVSNVSEDCTEIFDMDLMARYAEAIAALLRENDR